jgi:hypothetical protein
MTVDPAPAFVDFRQLVQRCLKDRIDAAESSGSVTTAEDLARQVAAFRKRPRPCDAAMVDFANRLALEDFELLTLALCLAAEDDAHIARMLARAQDPVGGSRPVTGLLATLFREFGATPLALCNGGLVRHGIVVVGDERAALPERSLQLAPGLAAALNGYTLPPPGLSEFSMRASPLPEAHHDLLATALSWSADEGEAHILVLRSTSEADGKAIIWELAQRLDRPAVAVTADRLAANAAWLTATRALPVIRCDAGPGERTRLPDFAPYSGLVVVGTGFEGAISCHLPAHEIQFATPDENARKALWLAHGADPATAIRAAAAYRQGPSRVAELARQAGFDKSMYDDNWQRLAKVVRTSKSELDSYARRSFADVERSELVLPGEAMAELDLLIERIRQRNRLADTLGPGVARRYTPGVRALFNGESGTGKTLAAHWLSSQSGLPLYRVDQAVLTSKWIGETEKNLSAVLDAAQNADVLLFFDEADALFGARTDVNDAHDRHANAQTNYLLQRIEDYEGVVVMATNGRDRFDPAFVRRIDSIIPFPMPDGAARLRLWQVHLGDGHALDADEMGRVASNIELSGGHIRNIVLSAAVRANLRDGRITLMDIGEAAREEYAKLGRPPPDFAR